MQDEAVSYIPGAAACASPMRSGNRVRTFIDGPEIARRLGEAIASARHSVWATVAFISDDFLFPDGPLFDVLDRYDTFTLAGLIEERDGKRQTAYVHAKMMVVDDVWLTLGSCNLHPFSLSGHSEMNVSVWDAEVVKGLRTALFDRHLGVATASLDDRAALARFKEIAQANGARLAARQVDWQSRAFSLSPQDYGRATGIRRDLT